MTVFVILSRAKNPIYFISIYKPFKKINFLSADYSIFLDCLIITDKMGKLLSFFILNHFGIYTF